MSQVTATYHARPRWLELPLDLLGLPLMLLLLYVIEGWLVLGIYAVLGVLFISSLRGHAGRWSRLYVHLFTLVVQLVGFYLCCRYSPYCSAVVLWQQVLWIFWFLLGEVLGLRLARRLGLSRYPIFSCVCDRRRHEALIAEYKRFDKILVTFCLLAIGLCLPFIQLVYLGVALGHILSIVLIVLSFGLIAFELLHISWLKRHLAEESWIPVLDNRHQVISRVARSEVKEAKGILPRVRLMAVSEGMLYLEQTEDCVSNTDDILYDTPFSDWLTEDDTPEAVAQRMIDARYCGIRRTRPRELLRYQTTSVGSSQLIYLYVVELSSPLQLCSDCLPAEGKWWCHKLLAVALKHGGYALQLENELPLLEQTVFLAQRLQQVHQEL